MHDICLLDGIIMSDLKSKPATPAYRAGWENVFGKQRGGAGPTHRAIDVSRLNRIAENKYEAENGIRVVVTNKERRA